MTAQQWIDQWMDKPVVPVEELRQAMLEAYHLACSDCAWEIKEIAMLYDDLSAQSVMVMKGANACLKMKEAKKPEDF